MIFRERVGGGGREKSATVPMDEVCRVVVGIFWLSAAAIAGGGSRNDMPRAEGSHSPFPTMSVEEAGVGGRLARGILRQEGMSPSLSIRR